jgi:hypothetical protein
MWFFSYIINMRKSTLGIVENDKNTTGIMSGYLDNLYVDNEFISNAIITAPDVSLTTFLGMPINYYEGVSSNIQTQINNIQAVVNGGSSGGGGSFCIYGEATDLKTSVNSGYFGFGASLITPAYKLGIFLPACTLVSIGIASTASPTGTQPIISILKLAGGTNPGTGGSSGIVSSITIPFSQSYNRINTNVVFALGDAINVLTTTSSGNSCGNTKITLIFQTTGVQGIQGNQGITPTFSIGNVTTSSIPTATLTGTQTNPILNFGLVPGQNGISPSLSIGTVTTTSTASATLTGTTANPILNFGLVRGEKGNTGNTPSLSIGTVTNLPSNNTPTTTLTGTLDNPILNFGLVSGQDGISPNFTIGNVTTTEFSTATLTGTSANPILNLGLVQGIQGIQGDKGNRGSQASSTLEAIEAAGVATGAAGAASGFAASAASSASAAAASALTATTNYETRVSLLENKTQFQQASLLGLKTTIISDLSVNNGIADQFRVTALTGNIISGSISAKGSISATGDINGSANINAYGNINANHIVTANIDYQSDTLASTINIGKNSTIPTMVNVVNIGDTIDNININGNVYINGVLYSPYIPFNFFDQNFP